MTTFLEFKKNNSGVHLMSNNSSEYTICGDAWDGDEMVDGNQKTMIDLQGFQKVTCKKCKIEIANISNYLKMISRKQMQKKEFYDWL